jgi:hypothetical protein
MNQASHTPQARIPAIAVPAGAAMTVAGSWDQAGIRRGSGHPA